MESPFGSVDPLLHACSSFANGRVSGKTSFELGADLIEARDVRPAAKIGIVELHIVVFPAAHGADLVRAGWLLVEADKPTARAWKGPARRLIASQEASRDTHGRTLPLRFLGPSRQIRELRVAPQKAQLDRVGRPVAVLREDQLRQALLIRLLAVVVVVAVDEQDEVGVLLDRA
jgi:hypothetical protein